MCNRLLATGRGTEIKHSVQNKNSFKWQFFEYWKYNIRREFELEHEKKKRVQIWNMEFDFTTNYSFSLHRHQKSASKV